MAEVHARDGHEKGHITQNERGFYLFWWRTKLITKLIRIFILVFFCALLPSPSPVSAKMVSYIKEYTYQASEVDSKLTSRTVALEQVKRLLLEELGAYLISETEVKNFQLTNDRVNSYAAGIVMTVIIDEKWDGKTYFLKAKISSDTDELVKSIDQIRRNQDQNQNMEELKKKTEQALKEIERLKDELGKREADKSAKEKFAKAVSKLTAMDWFIKGHALKFKAKNNEEALKAFSKAIEINPNFAPSYAGRAAAYNELGQFQKAVSESEQAIRIDPNLAWSYNTLGWAYNGLRKFRRAIEPLSKAIELSPKYTWAYVNRSWAHFATRNYEHALADAEQAIALDPGLAHGYFRKARVLASLTKTDEAVRNFDKAIELNPEFAGAFLQRGYLFLKVNKSEQGMEDLKKAANLGNIEAQNFLSSKGVKW